jgi:lipopolysaccharide export system permease protein
MIFKRALQRELTYTALAILSVLLAIMLVAMMVRILGIAAQAQADPRDIFALTGLTVFGYLADILIVTLFASILFVLTRWSRHSETVIWLSCGVKLWQFVQPVAIFSVPLLATIAFFAFFGGPWMHQQSQQLKARFVQREAALLLVPGEFRELPSQHLVFFIATPSPSSLSSAQQKHTIFAASSQADQVSIILADHIRLTTGPDNAQFIVLENGYRYDGKPDQPDYRIMSFQRYGIRLDVPRTIPAATTKSRSTRDLIAITTAENRAELAWRMSLPIIAMNLMLLAIPLAYQNPRNSRVLNLIFAALIYLTYSNMLNLVQAKIAQEKLSFSIGVFSLHGFVFMIAVALFWLRAPNRSGWALIRRHLVRKR